MTDKEMQDGIWARLSPDLRTEIKTMYDGAVHLDCDLYRTGTLHAFENIFGDHNLTSDEEPEEVLCVSKNKVLARYNECCSALQDRNLAPELRGYERGVNTVLRIFFPDTCLPPYPSEPKPTPKYKCGDKAIVINGKYKGKICEIYAVDESDDTAPYQTSLRDIEDGSVWLSESDLAPYTEPKFKVGDKVKVVEHKSVSEIDIIGNENKIGQYHVKYYGWFKPEDIEPYTEPEPQQTEEDMEEKELNLCELLVNQYNDSTYSPIYGEVDVTDIACDRLVIKPKHSSDNSVELFPDGRFSKNGDCQLWPSRDLYLKYPLESAKAWQIWAESRKPKRDYGVKITWHSNHENKGHHDERVLTHLAESEADELIDRIKSTIEQFRKDYTQK